VQTHGAVCRYPVHHKFN